MLSYFYCELRIEISNKSTANCGCEKIMNDGYSKSSLPSMPHTHTLKDKLNEPYLSISNSEIDNSPIINTSCFIFRSTDLQNGFLATPYHPPALIS